MSSNSKKKRKELRRKRKEKRSAAAGRLATKREAIEMLSFGAPTALSLLAQGLTRSQ